MAGASRLSTCSTPKISSPFHSGTPMVLRMLAPSSDSEPSASRGASAASTAARPSTTRRATLRVSATGPSGAIGAPSGPRTRVTIGNSRPLSGCASSINATVACVARGESRKRRFRDLGHHRLQRLGGAQRAPARRSTPWARAPAARSAAPAGCASPPPRAAAGSSPKLHAQSRRLAAVAAQLQLVTAGERVLAAVQRQLEPARHRAAARCRWRCLRLRSTKPPLVARMQACRLERCAPDSRSSQSGARPMRTTSASDSKTLPASSPVRTSIRMRDICRALLEPPQLRASMRYITCLSGES